MPELNMGMMKMAVSRMVFWSYVVSILLVVQRLYLLNFLSFFTDLDFLMLCFVILTSIPALYDMPVYSPEWADFMGFLAEHGGFL